LSILQFRAPDQDVLSTTLAELKSTVFRHLFPELRREHESVKVMMKAQTLQAARSTIQTDCNASATSE